MVLQGTQVLRPRHAALPPSTFDASVLQTMALFEPILSRHSFAFLCIAFFFTLASADLNNDTSPTFFFQTVSLLLLPHINAPTLIRAFPETGAARADNTF